MTIGSLARRFALEPAGRYAAAGGAGRLIRNSSGGRKVLYESCRVCMGPRYGRRQTKVPAGGGALESCGGRSPDVGGGDGERVLSRAIRNAGRLQHRQGATCQIEPRACYHMGQPRALRPMCAPRGLSSRTPCDGATTISGYRLVRAKRGRCDNRWITSFQAAPPPAYAAEQCFKVVVRRSRRRTHLGRSSSISQLASSGAQWSAVFITACAAAAPAVGLRAGVSRPHTTHEA